MLESLSVYEKICMKSQTKTSRSESLSIKMNDKNFINS